MVWTPGTGNETGRRPQVAAPRKLIVVDAGSRDGPVLLAVYLRRFLRRSVRVGIDHPDLVHAADDRDHALAEDVPARDGPALGVLLGRRLLLVVVLNLVAG